MAQQPITVTSNNQAIIEMFMLAEAKGWSRKLLRLEIGCNHKTLASLASGHHPIRMCTARKVAAVLGGKYTPEAVYRMSQPALNHPCAALVELINNHGSVWRLERACFERSGNLSRIIKGTAVISLATAVRLSQLSGHPIAVFLPPYPLVTECREDTKYLSKIVVNQIKPNKNICGHVGQKLGLSANTVRRFLRGEKLNSNSAKKIVRATNGDTTVGELALGNDQATKKWRKELNEITAGRARRNA